MGLVFHLICLFFTLFVLQSYVSSGFHAREHRLLPLVLGLIALNSFYRITYYVTGEAQTLRILTDLLAIHMLYLMIHYVGDFMKFQLKLRTEVILFCSLVLFNSMLIIRAAQRETYQDAFRIALLCYTCCAARDVSGCVSDCAALLYGNSSGAGYLCESEKRGFCLGGTCK